MKPFKCKQMKPYVIISSVLSFDIQFENLTLATCMKRKTPNDYRIFSTTGAC